MSTRGVRGLLQGLLLATVLLPGPLLAGDFTVSPIRMELGAAMRTGAFTVRNEGKEPLAMQVRGMSWTQDDKGQDQYEDARDLVYFPRVLSVGAGQEAVIRVGIRQPPPDTEKTYRLFIEELPAVGGDERAKGPALSFLVRFGAPVFVKPARVVDRLEFEDLELRRGQVGFALHNAGTQHQLVENILLKGMGEDGKELFAVTLTDRYLLAGTRKQYRAPVPKDICARLATVRVEVRTDQARADGQIPVGSTNCQ